jgi:hypothetical protein
MTKAQRVELVTWVLIYGGLIALSLGWFIAPMSGPWGELLASGGGMAAVAGAALIVVRSRMKP